MRADVMKKWATVAAGAVAAGVVVNAAARRARRFDPRNKVVIVSGGGRGLGYAIAEEFAARGALLAICGRDFRHVAAAVRRFEQRGVPVYGAACDMSDSEQVEEFFADVAEQYGGIDIVVNNAGECFVGPAVHLQQRDMEHALRSIFWTVYHGTMTALPYLRANGQGRIVNVTSFAGKIGLPHMAAYSAAKFAATGFSETIASELAREGIFVSTVAPPPLRNGAPMHVHFTGDRDEEFKWFTWSLTSALVATDTRRAARVVVDAAEYGDGERSVSALSWLLTRAHGAMPNFVSRATALVNRFMPHPLHAGALPMQLGYELVASSVDQQVHRLSERARRDELEFAPGYH